jgi:DNA-directed RNA polymerase specialized sigma24 family protein
VAPLEDDELRALIRSNPDAGWRAFIDQYTPLIVGLIRRAGLEDRDELMEVYVLMCERLSEHGFARLKSQDAGRGSIGGWLAVLTRHAAVDWVRSRKGRRRVFQAIRVLSPFDQRVFESYYWDARTPTDIAVIEHTSLASVFQSLERIQGVMSDRHRAELMSLALRSKAPVALDETDAAESIADPHSDPETDARIAQANERYEAALRQLSPEEAAIVRLKYVEGLTNADIERAIGVSGVTTARMASILSRLRAALEQLGIDAREFALTRGSS